MCACARARASDEDRKSSRRTNAISSHVDVGIESLEPFVHARLALHEIEAARNCINCVSFNGDLFASVYGKKLLRTAPRVFTRYSHLTIITREISFGFNYIAPFQMKISEIQHFTNYLHFGA